MTCKSYSKKKDPFFFFSGTTVFYRIIPMAINLLEYFSSLSVSKGALFVSIPRVNYNLKVEISKKYLF